MIQAEGGGEDQYSMIQSEAGWGDYIFEMIYNEAQLNEPQRGIIHISRLTRSSKHDLPDEDEIEGRAA